MGVKVFECECGPGEEVVFRFRKPDMELLSPEMHGHLLEARREFLMAMRSVIDAVLSAMEEREKPTSRRVEIKVE
jgi:hypothetical protein